VVVKDAKGATVANLPLGPGSTEELSNPDAELHESSGTCTFNFTVPGVQDSDHYEIDVAGIPIRRTQKQLRDDSWTVHVNASQH
jgi:hypothetical protein